MTKKIGRSEKELLVSEIEVGKLKNQLLRKCTIEENEKKI